MWLHLVIGSPERSQAGADGTVIWGATASPNSRRSWQRPECSPAWETGPPCLLFLLSLSYFSSPIFVLPHPCQSDQFCQVLMITKIFHLPKLQFPHLKARIATVRFKCIDTHSAWHMVSSCEVLRGAAFDTLGASLVAPW